MKINNYLFFMISIVLMSFSSIAAEEQPERVDIAVLGGDLCELTATHRLIKLKGNPIVFTNHLGGLVVGGNFPYTWIIRSSWRHHSYQQRLAESYGCSTLDVRGVAKIDDLQCLVNGLLKELGPERLRENYQLVEIQDTHDSKAPMRIIFRNTKTNQLKTVIANSIKLANQHDDILNKNFVK